MFHADAVEPPQVGDSLFQANSLSDDSYPIEQVLHGHGDGTWTVIWHYGKDRIHDTGPGEWEVIDTHTKYPMRHWISIVENGLVRQPRDDNQTHLTSHPTILKNPKFRQWFEGSRVVDGNGLPLVCYHGSFDEFTEFKHKSAKRESFGFNRLGFWFDVHPATAAHFAGYEEDNRYASTGSVMPVFLNIKTPYALDSEYLFDWEREEYIEARNEYQDAWKARNKATGSVDAYNAESALRQASKRFDAAKEAIHNTRLDSFSRIMKKLPKGDKSTTQEVAQFQASLIEQGYDGIHLINTTADFGTRDHQTSDWWIAFNSNQIKSIWSSEFTSSPHIHEDTT